MRKKLLIVCALLFCASVFAAEQPLRIFLRAGKKTHGPAGNGQHDGPTFLKEWKQMLAERGAVVDGAIGFPTAEQLEKTDVIVFYTEEGGTIAKQDRANLDKFLKRGGGVVAIHDSVCGNDAHWWKTIIGGAWEHRHSKWLEAEVPIYYLGDANPITTNCSNFEFDDEIYYDLHMMPEVKVLAASWTPDRRNMHSGRPGQHIYDVSPQMWTYEKGHRAFVSIPGHHWKSFKMPHFRAVLLRGVAWAGRRNPDSLLKPDEIASLRYPEGGPTEPKKALSLLELHPEFNINVFASEPLITKPINVDWDPAGRMWVAETPEYPNGRRGIRPEQGTNSWKDQGGLVNKPGKQDRPAYDRISIVTDSDADGVADKKHVFFEGLELVTGFVFHKDGVIVAQAPDILWLRDVDGDGKAEKVETLYTGLGTFDTHAVINNLRWGFDGWIYATHGYSAGNVMSPDGTRSFGRIGSGVIRFKPDGSAFEQYSSKGGNTWGLDITSDNEVLFTQPTSDDLLNHVVLPEYALARGKVGNTPSYKAVIHHRQSRPLIKYENLAYVQIDLVGLFTASAGAAIYEHGSWPESWNRSYFTTEPTINILHHEIVKRAGVTFTADKTRDEEFVGGRDKWYRPIETRIGPDGALYVLDFYNQAVVHNDTRGPQHNAVNAAVRPDRDHYFGRIHRIDHKQAKRIPVPDLSKAGPSDLATALDHPNRAVRFSAHRLLVERPAAEAIAALKRPFDGEVTPESRIHRLWVLHQIGDLPPALLTAAAGDTSAAVRKNAMQVAAAAKDVSAQMAAILERLRDNEPRVKLEALNALAAHPVDKAACDVIVAQYATFGDQWLRSAAVGALSRNPGDAIAAALGQAEPQKYQDLVSLLVAGVAEQGSSEAASALAIAAAKAPAPAGSLKVAILNSLTREMKRDVLPALSPELESALRSALSGPDEQVAAAALPLAVRWDSAGKLVDEQKKVASALSKKLEAGSDDDRITAATSLIGARRLDPSLVSAVTRLVGSSASERVQRQVIQALGDISEAGAAKELAAAFPKVPASLRDDLFAQLVKRPEGALALIDGIKAGSVSLPDLGPSSVHRLRTHSDTSVAARARATIDELRGPEAKEKNALVAKLAPEVSKRGDAIKGKAIFEQNCAVCHMYNGSGKTVGPDLTGMGAHGASELLNAILDPNREVDPSYLAWTFETKDGESYDGVIVTENRSAITLRNNSGEMQLKTSDLQSRRNTGRSLMPEGFEALGVEPLRDMLTYLAGSDNRYRIIDLRSVFSADTSRGLFLTPENRDDTLRFRKFGLIKAGDVPFEVINPTRTSSGNNIVILKGGEGIAKSYPQKVQIGNLNIAASRLHFLGGVAGWGWPCCGPNGNKGMPAAKVAVAYADGQSDEFVLTNGVDIADHVGPIDVPGSTGVPGLLSRGQVRTFSRDLKGKAPIKSITLESFDNALAPAFVAITAETREVGARQVADAGAVGAATGTTAGSQTITFSPRAKKLEALRGLIVGGGSSHDFDRWFNKEDLKTIRELKVAWFDYISAPQHLAAALPNLDVLYLSNNQPIADKAARDGIFQFADAGRTLLLVHPALWYNWADWPEYNRVLVGGGSRSHDKFGEFEVKVTRADHPLMAGVPASFKITDELYHFVQATNGTPIEVLAAGTSPVTGKTFPVAWVTKHPKARIFCLTLGHDGKSHEHAAYKRMLVNAVRWGVE